VPLDDGLRLEERHPIVIPSALLSSLRATTLPSLFESTTTGLPSSAGWNARSHET
jgi:hypothetical protein